MVADWRAPLEESARIVESQHKDIFELSDKLFAAVRRADGGTAVSGMVRTLTHFLRLHLDVEENLMTRAGYPGLPEHKSGHATLSAKIAAVAEKNERGVDVSDDVQTLISHFIMHHDDADVKFSSFLRDRPGCSPAAVAT